MALASLIIGCAALDDGMTPRAALPFLGQSLLEYQARQAAAAGARHNVILVERVPAALVAGIDRLKRDGLDVELARTVADAADRIPVSYTHLDVYKRQLPPTRSVGRGTASQRLVVEGKWGASASLRL